jgi:threonine synthase
MDYRLIDSITGKVQPENYTGHLSTEGNLLDLECDGMFSPLHLYDRGYNMWRYREALPVSSDADIVSFREGFTPLLSVDFGKQTLLVKQEQLFSTGSYKDRGASVLISHAKNLGIKSVVQDSSGNAGCAIAAYAASARIACNIYLQADTSPAKIAQIQMYGAHIHYVNGSREDAAKAALQAAATQYYASHCYNPFFFHGTKTFAYEVCEQLNWNAPDAVVLPAGNGTLIIGCNIGFNDLYRAGIIDKLPKIIAVQAENCAPLATASKLRQTTFKPVNTKHTLAEGIAIAHPVRGNQILRMVKETEGMFITVNEDELYYTWRACGVMGFYIEPTSAATIAGALTYVGNHDVGTVVTLFSGHGLKSTEKVLKYFS